MNVAGGLSLIYENLVDGITHDCGVVRGDTLPILLLEFIIGEGDPGDVVTWDGKPIHFLMKETRA